MGADERAFKTHDQKELTKDIIEEILLCMRHGLKLIPPVDFEARKQKAKALAGKGWNWKDYRRTLYPFEQLKPTVEVTLISGHCPVGEEYDYCVDCNQWLKYKNELSGWDDIIRHSGHRKVKVFNKGGVDTWAEIIAAKLGIPTEIYPALAEDWNDRWACVKCGMVSAEGHVLSHQIAVHGFSDTVRPKRLLGYCSRNLQIAKACDILYDIEPMMSCPKCKGTGTLDLGHGQWIACDYVRRPKTFPIHCDKGKIVNYSGGTFTMLEAKKLGKEVYQIVV